MSDKMQRARQRAAGVALKVAAKAEEKTGGDLAPEKRSITEMGADGVASGLMSDNRGQVSGGAEGAVNLVVALVVGGLMAAFLLPIAIDEITAVDTTTWDGGAAALWNILPVMIVLAIFLFFVGVALRRSGRM